MMHGGRQADEAELVRRVKKEDPGAARILYEAHARYLDAVCGRYITDPEEVADILQDSFVKIFTGIRRFEWRGEGSLRAWMRRIVVNEALMRLRERARTARTAFAEEFPEPVPDVEPEVEGIGAAVLYEMIRALPEGYRTVFNLYVFEQKSHREIAALLGISENTSFSQLSRARALLARRIREYRKKQEQVI